ncbi:hypothetical protein EYF80_029196 [Liparis tanakae]|uniref:Uncharacterized protein n=1 Tax=Liparis tanakae TaxID=230148 RepID=A0A4Z2H5T0_9TELE|nr:hypothetical protein EYF80_029196 [Liparis tanakae]
MKKTRRCSRNADGEVDGEGSAGETGGADGGCFRCLEHDPGSHKTLPTLALTTKGHSPDH